MEFSVFLFHMMVEVQKLSDSKTPGNNTCVTMENLQLKTVNVLVSLFIL
jgi:hypothetical protein